VDGERIRRLVGDGESGGGLPLPDAFGKILEHLLDHRTATSEELVKVVTAALDFKKARVLVTWRSWKALTGDLLDQLADEGFIAQMVSKLYVPAKKLVPGESLLVIPEADIRVTVYTAAQRGVLDKIEEVRSEAAASGVLNRDMGHYIDEIRNVVDQKRKRREAHAGSIVPLESEPGSFRMCTKCTHDFELNTENFSVFKSRTEYYWNRLCIPCKKELKELDRNLNADKRTATIKRDMERFINSAVPSPSVQEVMDHVVLQDDVLVRKYWDELAAIGKVPSRTVPWK